MKKESLNLGALNSQVIGRKDITRSLFDIWKEVFQKRKTKETQKHDTSQMKTYDTHDSLYSMISIRDHELIVDGIHENFLQLHYHDPMMHKTVDCLNALGISDLLHQCFMRSHNTSLYAYHPPITITVHCLLAHAERPIIEWPKSFQRHRMLLLEKMEILRSWRSKIPPYISRHLLVHSFVEDTVSPLLHILSPADLRPVEKQNIVRKSTARYMNDTDYSRKGNSVASSMENVMPESSKAHDAACIGFSRGKTNISKVICESSIQKSPSSLGSGGCSELVKLNSNKHEMKPPIGSFNFFDRFRNLCSKGLQNVSCKEN